MMNERVASISAALPAEVWESIPERDRTNLVRWAPLLVVNPLTAQWLGPTEAGSWVLGVPDRDIERRRNGGFVFESEDQSFYPVLPLLDRSPAEVRADLDDVARQHGLDPNELWDVLPWRAVIRTGIGSGRNGYLNRALDWAEDLAVLGDMAAKMSDVDDRALSDETKERIAALLATLS